MVGIAATSALTVAGLAIAGHAGSAGWRLLPAGVSVLAVSAMAAPISLLADLHQPGRFWHFYAHLTPWSWMSIGAFLLPVFVVLAMAFCLLWWMGKSGLMRVVGILLALSAISILLYTGLEVMVVRARPLWNTIFLPINFALTGWLSTIGAMLLVSRWLPGGLSAMPSDLVRRLGLTAFALLLIGALSWTASGLLGLDPSFDAAMRLFELFPVWKLSLWGSLLAGVAVFGLLIRRGRFLSRPGYSFLVAVVMLASGWIFRWITFMAVQGVPKYGAGLYVVQMPLGGDGLLGMIGVLGLCIALISIVTIVFDRFPGRGIQVLALR
ncbi:MAG: NrfD/PsrC family molybdoenzyme membrane anchor subunit [Burkholderiales bacterium]